MIKIPRIKLPAPLVPLWERARRWLDAVQQRLGPIVRGILKNPVVASVTPLGWSTLVSAFVFAFIGWNRGWLEFRGLAVMAVIVLLMAVGVLLRHSGHKVELELHRPRVQAGEEALGRILVTAADDRGSGSATMEFPVGKAVAHFHVGTLEAHDEHEEMFSIPTRRRGVIPIGPVRSIRADLLGMVSRKKTLTDQIELFIHPRIVAVEMGAMGILRDVEGITTSNLSSSDVSFHALREYAPGDDRRSVHWRTTARVGKLMVRQFEETMRAHLVIVLASREQDYADPEDFELAISTTGSMAASAMREERQVTVLTSTGELWFPSTIGLLDELARLELTTHGLGHRDLAVKAGNTPGVSVTSFVTGLTPPATLRGAQLALPPGIFAFALRCGAEAELTRRKVGDLPIVDVPTLEDIRLGLRSVT